MAEIFQILWKGEKPSEEILSFFDKLTDKFQIPIGEAIIIKEPSEKFLYFFNNYTEKIQIPTDEGLISDGILCGLSDVGEALDLKFTLMVPLLTKKMLKGKPLWEEDFRIQTMVKNLIPYWYARKWLPPLRDYSNTPSLETRHESETYIKEGRKPPKEILSFVENYIDSIHVPNGAESSIMTTFVHGAGNISPLSSPIYKIIKYMRAGGAKLAKDLWGLEEAETQQERDHIYRECMDLVQFWTMKGWLSIISPFATYEDLIEKLESKENELGDPEL